MEDRTRLWALTATGCSMIAASIFALTGYLLVGLRTGPSGGPPNIGLPSVFLGVFTGICATGLIAHYLKPLTDGQVVGLGLLTIALAMPLVIAVGAIVMRG